LPAAALEVRTGVSVFKAEAVIIGFAGLVQVTVKLTELVAVCEETVTLINPVVAIAGTIVVILFGVLADTTASTPLNLMMLLKNVLLKLVPIIVTDVPADPLTGVNDVIVGANPDIFTVKLFELAAVSDPTLTLITPEVAAAGTVAVKLVAVLAVTVAIVPLNVTILLAGVALKFVPVMVTAVPAGPLRGANKVIVGDVAVKLLVLVAI